jgi:DNA-binding MarR family transcriptional regulator
MGASSAVLDAYRELIAEVYELAGRSRRTSDDHARRHGETAARWHVLSVVQDEALPVPRIADRLGVTRQSVQAVVDALAADGLVELAANPAHRRSRLVQLTERGQRVVEQLFESSAPGRSAMLSEAGLTAPELQAAAATLRQLLEHFADIDETDSHGT